jgi:nucleoside-diphosphate-sugar epimerase
MASYLVTGGAGFIGSHLCEELVSRGHQVRVVDSFITGKRLNLAHLPHVEVQEGDLANPGVAEEAVRGVEYVLHQAAIPSVPRSVKDPLTSHRANVDASLRLLIAARDAGVRRLVYAGSSSAYGDTPTLPKREDMPTNRSRPTRCRNSPPNSTVSCSRDCTGSRRSPFGTSTSSVRARIRRPHTLASSRFSPRLFSRGNRPSSTAMESRRETSRSSQTWSTACCEPQLRPESQAR